MSYFDDYQYGGGKDDQLGSTFDPGYGYGQTGQDTAVTMPQATQNSQWAPVAPMYDNTISSFNTNSHFSPTQSAPTPPQAVWEQEKLVEMSQAPISRVYPEIIVEPNTKYLPTIEKKFRKMISKIV